MGMHIRVEALKRATNTEERRGAIDTAARRLVDTLGMGKEYQVLGITSHDRSEGDAAEEFGRSWTSRMTADRTNGFETAADARDQRPN